ncbi:hypothetical protein GCM10027615_71390 [Plantactinospora veratri]
MVPTPGMLPAAYPQPVTLPPGWGALVVSVNRGPYRVPAPTSSRLLIDGRDVIGMAEGTYHIPVPAGEHEVRYATAVGFPLVTTRVLVQPGVGHHLSFRFGAWRNRVYDGRGADVTTSGSLSNYSRLLVSLVISLGVGGLVCGCGAWFLVQAS